MAPGLRTSMTKNLVRLAIAGAIGLIGNRRQRLGQQGRVGEIGQTERIVASRQDSG